jgi:hypothetical protein
MDSDKATQVSSEFKSGLSEIMPELVQLLQNNQVSRTLEIELELDFLNMANQAACTCCLVNGIMKCGSMYQAYPHKASEDTLGLDPEKVRQLCTDVESKLFTVLRRLSLSTKQTYGIFKAQILIDPDTANPEQPIVCQWVSDTLKSNILQCSNP